MNDMNILVRWHVKPIFFWVRCPDTEEQSVLITELRVKSTDPLCVLRAQLQDLYSKYSSVLAMFASAIPWNAVRTVGSKIFCEICWSGSGLPNKRYRDCGTGKTLGAGFGIGYTYCGPSLSTFGFKGSDLKCSHET